MAAFNDRGSYNASSNAYPSSGGSGGGGSIVTGDTWFVSVPGTINGISILVGDSICALVNAPGQTPSKWTILQAAGQYLTSSISTDIIVHSLTIGRGGNGVLTNTALGYFAVALNTTGHDNTGVGNNALANNFTGTDNTATGSGALAANTGTGNTAVGRSALASNAAGGYNVAVGLNALALNVSGNNNLGLGTYAGLNETGSNKLYIDSTGTGTTTPLIKGTFDPTGGYAGTLVHNAASVTQTNGVFNTCQTLGGFCGSEVVNGKQGIATLVAGTVTVNNTNITVNSRIFLTPQETGLFTGSLRVSARAVGTSFTILSTALTDTCDVVYEIFEPA